MGSKAADIYVTYLEKHVHDEDLTALASEGVEAIRQGGEDTDQDSNHHHSLKESTEYGRGADR